MSFPVNLKITAYFCRLLIWFIILIYYSRSSIYISLRRLSLNLLTLSIVIWQKSRNNCHNFTISNRGWYWSLPPHIAIGDPSHEDHLSAFKYATWPNPLASTGSITGWEEAKYSFKLFFRSPHRNDDDSLGLALLPIFFLLLIQERCYYGFSWKRRSTFNPGRYPRTPAGIQWLIGRMSKSSATLM